MEDPLGQKHWSFQSLERVQLKQDEYIEIILKNFKSLFLVIHPDICLAFLPSKRPLQGGLTFYKYNAKCSIKNPRPMVVSVRVVMMSCRCGYLDYLFVFM